MTRTLMILIILAAFYTSTAVASQYTMPFGLATLPDARLAISDSYDTAGGDRIESIARFGTQVSRQEVIDFYRKALEAIGFQIYSSSDQADYAMFAAKRDDDRVTVYYKNQSDWIKAGESEFSIKAVYNKHQ